MPNPPTAHRSAASTPRRIRYRRGHGAPLPAGAIYVDRPSRWANPFRGERGAATATRAMLADDFRDWLLESTWADPRDGTVRSHSGCAHYLGVAFAGRPSLDDIRTHLRGHDLACGCPLDQPCHADVLIELANG